MSTGRTWSGRPKLVPRPSKADWLIEAAALAGLIAVLAVIAWGALNLPENVPTHVGPSGGIDSYGSKWQLLTVFFIASIGLYVLLTFSNRYPYWFNYPAIVTDENASILYRLGQGVIRWLKLIFIWMCAILAARFIFILPYDPGQSVGGLVIMAAFLVANALMLAYYIMKMIRAGKAAKTA